MTPLISVIIPVYNTGDRLSRCLDSMLAQSVRDLEIIAVNDGSTDNSPAICDEYARKDSRVKAIHMANGGVSAARNRGLEEATGTFVCFIDSDDWCEPWYIETFLSGMDDGVDLVLQGYVKERGEEEIDRRHLSDSTAAREAIPACFLENGLLDFGSPCCKLFRREILEKNSLAFPAGYSFGEDTVFFFKYIQYCRSIVCIGKEGYHYVENSPSSLSRRVHHSLPLLRFVKDSMEALQPWADCQEGKEILRKQNAKNVALSNRAVNNMFILGYGKKEQMETLAFFRREVRPLLDPQSTDRHGRVFLALTGLPEWLQRMVFGLFKAIGIIKVPQS